MLVGEFSFKMQLYATHNCMNRRLQHPVRHFLNIYIYIYIYLGRVAVHARRPSQYATVRNDILTESAIYGAHLVQHDNTGEHVLYACVPNALLCFPVSSQTKVINALLTCDRLSKASTG